MSMTNLLFPRLLGRPSLRPGATALMMLVALDMLVGQPAAYAANSACPTAASSTATSCTYASTGGEQTFTVPSGVTTVTVTAVGAPGGTESGGITAGRNGASVTATAPLSAGTTTLYVEVGGPGTMPIGTGGMPGGFNGGGGSGDGGTGGGASDVRTCSRSTCTNLSANDTRLVVAGGGGGGGALDGCGARGGA